MASQHELQRSQAQLPRCTTTSQGKSALAKGSLMHICLRNSPCSIVTSMTFRIHVKTSLTSFLLSQNLCLKRPEGPLKYFLKLYRFSYLTGNKKCRQFIQNCALKVSKKLCCCCGWEIIDKKCEVPRKESNLTDATII